MKLEAVNKLTILNKNPLPRKRIFIYRSTVNCQLSTVNCQLSPVNCQLSTVNCQLSTVNCQRKKSGFHSYKQRLQFLRILRFHFSAEDQSQLTAPERTIE